MSTMYTSCDSPKNSDMPNFSSWGFRTSQTKASQIASMSHYKTSSRRRPVKIVYDSQICLRRKNRGKIGLKSCSLNGALQNENPLPRPLHSPNRCSGSTFPLPLTVCLPSGPSAASLSVSRPGPVQPHSSPAHTCLTQQSPPASLLVLTFNSPLLSVFLVFNNST